MSSIFSGYKFVTRREIEEARDGGMEIEEVAHNTPDKIIRLAIDNPLPKQDALQMADTLIKVFAHEIAHKLQSERLFALPNARFVVEGGAKRRKLEAGDLLGAARPLLRATGPRPDGGRLPAVVADADQKLPRADRTAGDRGMLHRRRRRVRRARVRALA